MRYQHSSRRPNSYSESGRVPTCIRHECGTRPGPGDDFEHESGWNAHYLHRIDSGGRAFYTARSTSDPALSTGKLLITLHEVTLPRRRLGRLERFASLVNRRDERATSASPSATVFARASGREEGAAVRLAPSSSFPLPQCPAAGPQSMNRGTMSDDA